MDQTTYDVYFEDLVVATDVRDVFVPMMVKGLMESYPGDINNFARIVVVKHGYAEALAAAKAAEEAKKQAEADKGKEVDEPSTSAEVVEG